MLELVRSGLRPYVERELKREYAGRAGQVLSRAAEEARVPPGKDPFDDIAFLLKFMFDQWNAVFRDVLGHVERSYVSELRDIRNRWAHQATFSVDDTDRALDTGRRLLKSVDAPDAVEIDLMREDLIRGGIDTPTPSPRLEPGAHRSLDPFGERLAEAGPSTGEAIRLMDDVAKELGLRTSQTHAARKYRVGRDGPVAWISPEQRMLFFDLRTLARKHPTSDVAGLAASIARLSSQPSQSDMPPIPIDDVVESWHQLRPDVVEPFFRAAIGS